MKKPPRVERDRLRERDRQARAMMSVQAEQAAAGGGPDTRHHHHHHHNHVHHHHSNNIHVSTPNLFRGGPVRTDPDPQIQSKLGNYHLVKHLLDEPKRLIGIDGVPPSPAPSPTPSAHKSATGGRNCSPSAGQEFKKPGGLRGSSASSSSSTAGGSSATSHQQRGGFVKPADGKPPYGGRGGYPGQPVKYGGGSNDHRNHGLLPAKGPPLPHVPPSLAGNNGSLPVGGNSGGSVVGGNFGGGGGGGGSLASRTQFAGRLKLIEVNGSNSRSAIDSTDVENILKEMTVPVTPLTAIAQTPRKELESKFTFNPHLAKLTEVTPPEPAKPHCLSRQGSGRRKIQRIE